MHPKLCGNGCGFFGSASTLGLCSKCFCQQQANAASVVAAAPPAVDPPAPEAIKLPEQDRCRACKKRVRVARGFKCGCRFLFCESHRYPEEHMCTLCESHRYPEEHMCTFDYRAMGKHEIAKVNPKVKADKIQRI